MLLTILLFLCSWPASTSCCGTRSENEQCWNPSCVSNSGCWRTSKETKKIFWLCPRKRYTIVLLLYTLNQKLYTPTAYWIGSAYQSVLTNKFIYYQTRLSKILRFVSGKQFNYLLKPKGNNWSARHWQTTYHLCIETLIIFALSSK